MEWGLRAPITPRLGGNGWALPRLGKSEPNEEKETDPKRAIEQLAKLCCWNEPERFQHGADDELMELLRQLRGGG
jgi:hypothetical protein